MDTTLMVGESCSYLILGHGRSRTALVLQYRAAIVHAVLHSLDNIASLYANFKKSLFLLHLFDCPHECRIFKVLSEEIKVNYDSRKTQDCLAPPEIKFKMNDLD